MNFGFVVRSTTAALAASVRQSLQVGFRTGPLLLIIIKYTIKYTITYSTLFWAILLRLLTHAERRLLSWDGGWDRLRFQRLHRDWLR